METLKRLAFRPNAILSQLAFLLERKQPEFPMREIQMGDTVKKYFKKTSPDQRHYNHDQSKLPRKKNVGLQGFDRAIVSSWRLSPQADFNLSVAVYSAGSPAGMRMRDLSKPSVETIIALSEESVSNR